MAMGNSRTEKGRPSWWTPEGVLAKLQDGVYVGVVCETAVNEMAEAGIAIAPTTLRSQIAKWTESASWGDQFRAALAMWKRTTSGRMELSKEWHDGFLEAMEVCEGNGARAAKMAGVGYGIVLATLDKRNKCYDKEFAEKYRIAELERVGKIREKYMETAEGEGKAASRAQERILETSLPGLHAGRQELVVSGKVEHEHEHTHGISADLARQVALNSQDRLRRMMGARGRERERAVVELPAARDRHVIDLVPMEAVVEEKRVSSDEC